MFKPGWSERQYEKAKQSIDQWPEWMRANLAVRQNAEREKQALMQSQSAWQNLKKRKEMSKKKTYDSKIISILLSCAHCGQISSIEWSAVTLDVNTDGGCHCCGVSVTTELSWVCISCNEYNSITGVQY